MASKKYNSTEYYAQQLRGYLERVEFFARDFGGWKVEDIKHYGNIVCFRLLRDNTSVGSYFVKVTIRNDVPYTSLESVVDGQKTTREIKLKVIRSGTSRVSLTTFREYFRENILSSNST